MVSVRATCYDTCDTTASHFYMVLMPYAHAFKGLSCLCIVPVARRTILP